MSYRFDQKRFMLLDPQGQPVHDANAFLRGLELRNLSTHTVRAYGYDLLACFRWLQAIGKMVIEITSATLLDFVAAQKAHCASPRSINRQLNTVQLFYRFVTGKEIPRGAGSLVPAPHYRGRGRDHDLGLQKIGASERPRLKIKIPRTLVEPLSTDQVRLLLRQFTRYRDIALLYLMLLCGLRSHEALTIQCVDVSCLDKTLHVHGKGNKERVLPLPDPVATAIARYVSIERPPCSKTKLLFVILQGKNRGKPMTAAGLRSLFRTRRRTCSLRAVNPHRLRHTFGAAMARQGVTLPVLQRLMGHADGLTTLQYINLSMIDIADEFQRAVHRIAETYRR